MAIRRMESAATIDFNIWLCGDGSLTRPSGSEAPPIHPLMRQSMPSENSMKLRLLLVLFVLTILPAVLPAQTAETSGKPFVVEYYYKAKWGSADEFLQLFKKNHYPLLKKQVEMGRMLKVWMDQPRYHTTEDGRWDYRVTIVFKNSSVANEPFDEDAIKKQLWPDQAAYQKEEQRRFEILLSHWDLPIGTVDLQGK